jgi:hypothetical protein
MMFFNKNPVLSVGDREAIAATAGHWAMGQPIARGKGTNFDVLLPMDFEHMDPVCGTIETSVRVSVKKIK